MPSLSEQLKALEAHATGGQHSVPARMGAYQWGGGGGAALVVDPRPRIDRQLPPCVAVSEISEHRPKRRFDLPGKHGAVGFDVPS